MGVTSSSRFRADAEFLLKGNSNIMRLEQLMAKKAHRILDGNYNILVRLCEEGHFDALRCALNLSRKALAHPNTAALREMRHRLCKAFPGLTTETVGARILTFIVHPRIHRFFFGSSIVPRIDHSMPYLVAAEFGHWHLVQWMVVEAGVDVLTSDQRTGFGLLHAACKGGQVELLDKLLSWSLQIPTDRGLAPLHSSWHRSPDDGSFVPWVDVFAKGGVTPLMVATFFGHDNCVKLLLQRGASLRYRLRGGAAIPLPSGSSTLHCAARGGSSEVALTLLKGLYTSAGGISLENASSSDVRAPWEGNARYDLRAHENNIGLMPFKYASLMDGATTTLERMLHPSLPLALVIRQCDPEWRGHEGGVPRLYALALAALRESLISQLDSIAQGGSVTAEPLTDTATTANPLSPTPQPCATTSLSPDNHPTSYKQHMHAPARDGQASQDGIMSTLFIGATTQPQLTMFSNPTFESSLTADASQSPSRSSMSLLGNISTVGLHHTHQHLPQEAAPSLDSLLSTPSFGDSELSDSISFTSACSSLSQAPDSTPGASQIDVEHRCSIRAAPVAMQVHQCRQSSSSATFEPSVLAAAGTPADILGAHFFAPGRDISASRPTQSDSSVPSISDTLVSIAQARQLATSPFGVDPATMVLCPSHCAQNSAACRACNCGVHSGSGASCSIAQHSALAHGYTDAIPPHSLDRANSPDGHVLSGSTLYADPMHDRHASAYGATQYSGTEAPAGLLEGSAFAAGCTSHFSLVDVQKASASIACRHTNHTGCTSIQVSYSEFEEEHLSHESSAPHAPSSGSVFSRMLEAVDVSSCMHPGPHPGAATGSQLHHTRDPSRHSLPGNDALLALSDRSWAFYAGAGNTPLPHTGSVSAPGEVCAGAAASGFSLAGWYGAVGSLGDIDGASVAGYSSQSVAFLPSHRRSRSGFASFTQNLRHSLKSFGGMSRGCGSNCGEGGDAVMQSDDKNVVLCPICIDAAVTVSVQACSHGLCVDCARLLCTSAVKPVHCPLCRTTVDRFVKADGL